MNKKEDVIYYLIAGKNGFGVYLNKEKFEKAQDFFWNPVIERYSSKFEAFKNAIEIYNSMQTEFDAYYLGLVSELKLDWVLFRGDIIKMNKAARDSCFDETKGEKDNWSKKNDNMIARNKRTKIIKPIYFCA